MTENANGNVANRYYTWWVNELARTLTPRRPSAGTWRTLARNTPEGLEVFTRAGGVDKALGTLKPDAGREQIAALTRLISQKASTSTGQVLLRLSQTEIVERTIQIPEAASDVIEPVLQNQMERIVPWSQEDTRYGYRVVGPNPTSTEQLDIQVVATTKSILETALRRARSVGLSPYAIDYAPDTGGASSVELMSLMPDPVKQTAKAVRTFVAVALAVSVAISAFGLYHMWVRQAENEDLEARIASARSRVAEVKRLNEENAELRQQRERLVRRKLDEPAVIGLIEAMSKALPDNAYLTEMEIHGRDARVVGKAADPTGLITKLEGTPEFEDVHFSSATTREEGETAGTFSIISRAYSAAKQEEKP